MCEKIQTLSIVGALDNIINSMQVDYSLYYIINRVINKLG